MSNASPRLWSGRNVTPGPAGEALRALRPTPGRGRRRAIAECELRHHPHDLRRDHAERRPRRKCPPQKAVATVNCRIFPGVSVDAVKQQLGKIVADPKVKITTLGAPVASPVSDLRPDIEQAIAASIRKMYPGVALSPYLESGGTDGLVYRAAGIPTWASSGVFIKPDEMFAHGLDERIPVKSFYDGIEHIHDLARTLGGA